MLDHASRNPRCCIRWPCSGPSHAFPAAASVRDVPRVACRSSLVGRESPGGALLVVTHGPLFPAHLADTPPCSPCTPKASNTCMYRLDAKPPYLTSRTCTHAATKRRNTCTRTLAAPPPAAPHKRGRPDLRASTLHDTPARRLSPALSPHPAPRPQPRAPPRHARPPGAPENHSRLALRSSRPSHAVVADTWPGLRAQGTRMRG